MFGASNYSINQYKNVGLETGVATANPLQLIVMLYDGAIVACYSAVEHTKNNDYANKSQMIFKAIKIIQSGLRMSLNKQAGGKIAENLDALYVYMTNQLMKANIDNQVEPIQEVARLLTELRGAWDTISKSEAANAVAPANKVADFSMAAYAERV